MDPDSQTLYTVFFISQLCCLSLLQTGSLWLCLREMLIAQLLLHSHVVLARASSCTGDSLHNSSLLLCTSVVSWFVPCNTAAQ